MTGRERLPNRRASVVFEIELHGLRYTAGFSHFADGRPAEIFLQNRRFMTGAILRFPLRRTAAVFICRERDGAWLVCARGHGWLHGDRRSALTDAHWLAWNLGLPIREFVA